MLDVAAVAELLLRPFGYPGPLQDALVLLTALHDLGKISRSFRAMLQGKPGRTLHWKLTETLLRHHDTRLAHVLGSGPDQRLALYAASAGHHGEPPTDHLVPHLQQVRLHEIGPDAVTDALDLIDALAGLWPAASLDDLSYESALRLSLWLPGLVTAADWIGSNTDWFPPVPAGMSLGTYLDRARTIAPRAVASAGLSPKAAATALPFSFVLRPMQEAARDIPLPSGPTLAVIEDETGAGKTEAALILAQRMMQAGKGRGMFLALPTMATSDAMFARAVEIVPRLFLEIPTLTLAHGGAGLSEAFRDLPRQAQPGTDSAIVTDWLADRRRRALLADVGVGTVDQALLSVLKAKHAALRRFALSQRILIVDEVHEMGNPYMATELATLLQMQAAQGGSAILLTATLPLDLRARLVAAFETGAGRATMPSADPAYPALTVAHGEAWRNLAPLPGPRRGPVAVNRFPDAGTAIGALTQAAARGAACIWVRNAVDDAIAAVTALRAAGVRADLLHARFALYDRKRHEAQALGWLGRHGTDRAGRVLVATQVVESSLDIDADVMVSDLAPMAALIQRAGRLWRHMDRPPRPVPGPVLHVVSPDPAVVHDERWLQGTLGAGAWVYGVDDTWRSAQVLFATGCIDAPAGLRALVEAVHGQDRQPVPDAIVRAEIERQAKAMAEAAHAAHNVIDLGAGYRDSAAADDAEYPTRLGEPVRTLMLARRSGDGLVPWAEVGDAVDSCQLSEVQARAGRLARLDLPDQNAPDIRALKVGWPDWRQATVTVCPVGQGGVICDGLRYDAELGLLFG
jgi:CRISPR-associated endonuclease/helicase Cas3